MGKLKIGILMAMALLMAVVMALTWGSIGSVILGFCLVMMGIALLFHHFVIVRHSDDFLEDGNG